MLLNRPTTRTGIEYGNKDEQDTSLGIQRYLTEKLATSSQFFVHKAQNTLFQFEKLQMIKTTMHRLTVIADSRVS